MNGIINYANLANGVLSAYKYKTQKHMSQGNHKKIAMYISIFYSIHSIRISESKAIIKDGVRKNFGKEIEYLKENGYRISLYTDSNQELQILFTTPDKKYFTSTYPQCDVEW